LGVIQFGATRLVAQDRPAPAVSSDSASADQQIALMRKDIRLLPGKTAATFFQLDRRISMMIDLKVTSQIPLVQNQDETIQ